MDDIMMLAPPSPISKSIKTQTQTPKGKIRKQAKGRNAGEYTPPVIAVVLGNPAALSFMI